MKDGISLLSLKHHLLLSYLQSLVLVSARRATGDSLGERTPPTSLFSTVDREARGSGAGDLVDSMIEGRIVLEKIKVLESRMRYQIEKLVRVAEEAPSGKDVAEGIVFFFHCTKSSLQIYSFSLRSSRLPSKSPKSRRQRATFRRGAKWPIRCRRSRWNLPPSQACAHAIHRSRCRQAFQTTTHPQSTLIPPSPRPLAPTHRGYIRSWLDAIPRV